MEGPSTISGVIKKRTQYNLTAILVNKKIPVDNFSHEEILVCIPTAEVM